MPVVRAQFDQYLVPGARKVFVDEYNELPAVYPQWINIDSTTRAFEDDLVSTGLPVAVSRGEGEPIPFDRPRFRGRVRYVVSGFALGYEITQEAIEDNMYKPLTDQGSANLARSMREAEEISAHSIINGIFSTIMAYDGVPVVSTAHTGVGELTFANRPASDEDLSVAALKSASERFMGMQTDRGIRIQFAMSNLIVSNSGWWTAQEILGANFKSEANFAQTPNIAGQMGLTPFRSPYITDADMWLVTAPKAQLKWRFVWRRRPQDVSGYDARSLIGWYGIHARWAAGITDWRGIDGSPGA